MAFSSASIQKVLHIFHIHFKGNFIQVRQENYEFVFTNRNNKCQLLGLDLMGWFLQAEAHLAEQQQKISH